MTALDIVLCKAASNTDGFLTSYLKSRGSDLDLSKPRALGEALLGQVPELAGSAANAVGFLPHLSSQLLRLGGNLTGYRAANPENPSLTYAKWFNDHIGDPTKAGWKDTLYRLTSASDGLSLGSWGLGPSIATIVNQFKKP